MKNQFAQQVLSKKEEIIEKSIIIYIYIYILVMATCKVKEEESKNLRSLCDKMEGVIKKHSEDRQLQLNKNNNLKKQLEDYIKIIQMLDSQSKEAEAQTQH